MFPEATGTYEDVGEYNGKRCYQRTPDGYFLWWDGDDTWCISVLLGDPGMAGWARIDPNIEGVYAFYGTATGEATVTEI